MEIKIAAIGNVDSAKSTTISCILNDILDNGRGSARNKIIKYRHEQISGRTSSITQHYIKKLSKTIGFVDLAGHEKYLKTTTKGLSSCYIDYAMLTIGADRGIIGMTKEHIILSLALNIPLFIVITKIDISQEHKLNRIINRITKIMGSKAAGEKKCIIIKENDSLHQINNFVNDNICPIFLTSNTKGTNLNNLKKFIYNLDSYHKYEKKSLEPIFTIDDKFKVVGVGIVLSGKMKKGFIRVGDRLKIGPFCGEFKNITVKSIHDNFRNNIDILETGKSGCINIKYNGSKKDNFSKKDIKKNMVCLKNPKCIREFEAEVSILNHPTTIKINYQPYIHCGTVSQSAKICSMDKKIIRTGDKANIKFKFMFRPEYIEKDSIIVFREGKTKGIGKITSVKYI